MYRCIRIILRDAASPLAANRSCRLRLILEEGVGLKVKCPRVIVNKKLKYFLEVKNLKQDNYFYQCLQLSA